MLLERPTYLLIDVGTIDGLTYSFVRVENTFVADRDSNPNKKPISTVSTFSV